MDHPEPKQKISSQSGSQNKMKLSKLSNSVDQFTSSTKQDEITFKNNRIKDEGLSTSHIFAHISSIDNVPPKGSNTATKASEGAVIPEKDAEYQSEDHIAKLIEQGKTAIGPPSLQTAILKHLIEANAFPAVRSTDFTKQPYYIGNLLRLKASRTKVAFLLSRRKRRTKQSLYKASKDYKRLYDDWQGRSTRSYGRRKSRNRGQDEPLHYKYSGGDVVRSEKEYLETLQSLASADNVSQGIVNMCTSADIPAMNPHAPQPMNNSNGLILDPKVHFFRNANADHWTKQEEALFVEAYLQHPKQFGKIAQALPKKTPSQCVLFYYRSKKSIDLKAQLDKKRKAQVQKSRRRSNTFGRKPRGREKNKQSIPSPDHRSRKSRKVDQVVPSPAASSSSPEQLDVVGDKDISKSNYQAEGSLNKPEAEEIPDDLPPLEASPALYPCHSPAKAEVVKEEARKSPPSSEASGVKSITKINALLNSPTDSPEPKWNQSAMLEWFGENNNTAPPEEHVPVLEAPVLHVGSPVRRRPVQETHQYRTQRMPSHHQEQSHQASYRQPSSYYHSNKHPSTSSWTSNQSTFYPSNPHSSQPPRMNSSMTSQRSRLYHNIPYHGSTNTQRQEYGYHSYQRQPAFSYRESAQTLQPRLHQPILSMRDPIEPQRLRPSNLNGPRAYPQNPNSDPAQSLGSRFNTRHI
ncbi:DNA-binding protein snt1 [Entomophthora muscae]|uniref:DNA-binding protein snt1 n=1 Tax=Entomophthora muscae TaxID=34485 RepID=A0ACC2UNA8_9FUNG|nr:DNA-binding protein snt1 [Entomophthora muscae]